MKQKKTSVILIIAILVFAMLAGGCAKSADFSGEKLLDPPAADAAPPAMDAPAPVVDEPDWDGAVYRYNGNAPYDEIYVPNNERYLDISENSVKATAQAPMLTFSLKVDTASYGNVTRYIESRQLPPKDAVRTEELINYFSYDAEPAFTPGEPFGIYTELGPSPFDASKHMAFIRVKARDLDKSQLPSSNLTFLIDVSGSMSSYDKLPLLKDAFGLLVETLSASDTVSIVTYASGTATVLDSAKGNETAKILNTIERLESGGSTAGADGIQRAYKLAEKNFLPGGNNRIILATDGDFNVGTSSTRELEKLVAEKKDTGIYLSVLGVGTGNIRDDIMETLAKHGNGNYSYINSRAEAEKVLVDELASNLFVIAEDVKAQVEFNPENVKSYRLIGYENRALDNRDFNDDKKDAGEIGVGTDVIVLFEIELADDITGSGLKYASGATKPERNGAYGDEMFEVRLRYKKPGESESRLTTVPVAFDRILDTNSSDFKFACSVAAFGDMLRGSSYARGITAADALALAEGNLGVDEKGYRAGYLELLALYRKI